jgi:hypothetical protein
MNEDIIKWAREAGFVIDEVAQQHQPNCIFHTHHMVDELLHRFAALVRADEREALSKVTDEMVIASDKAMFGQIVQGYRRFETVRLGLEAALKARSQ